MGKGDSMSSLINIKDECSKSMHVDYPRSWNPL